MHRNVGTCLDPENPTLLEEEGGWQRHVWDVADLSSKQNPVDGWYNTPFGGKGNLPKHMIVGLVRDDEKYPPWMPEGWFASDKPGALDDVCAEFNYDDDAAPDPTGCRIFRKSFVPLKRLRQCIVERLDRDPIWLGRFSRLIPNDDGKIVPYSEWCRTALWGYAKGSLGRLPVLLCMEYDSKRRADEIIKFVLYKSPPESMDELRDLVEKKILFTVTWPKHQEGFEQGTVAAIRRDCFSVPDSGGSPEQFSFLQRRGICLPLMFDKVEVSGFGVTNGISKFQSQDYYGSQKRIKFKQARTPRSTSLCGRLALAMLPAFGSVPYTLFTHGTLRGDMKRRWSSCLEPESSNCRMMYFCWEGALNRMCGLSEYCCPGEGEARRRLHEECKYNPNGEPTRTIARVRSFLDIPRIFPENIFAGQCPERMGTQTRSNGPDSEQSEPATLEEMEMEDNFHPIDAFYARG